MSPTKLLILFTVCVATGCASLAKDEVRRECMQYPGRHVPEDERQLPRSNADVRQVSFTQSVEDVIDVTTVLDPAGDELAALGLMDLIALANQSSPDVASARARIHIADAMLAGARAEYRPRFIVSENYGVTDNPVQAFSFQLNQAQLTFAQDFNDPETIDNFHTQLRLQQGLYAGHSRLEQEHAAAHGRSAACQDLQALRNQLAFRVAQVYYRLLQARELVDVRAEAVEQVNSHLQVVQTRVRAETAVESDELSVQVRLAEAKEALITAENDLELA